MNPGISRVNRTHRQAQRTYDRISRWYDLLEGYWERSARSTALQHLNVAPGEKMLEIGPGPGYSLPALARGVGPQGMVCGLDLSQGMLHVAQNRLPGARLGRAPALCRGDAVRIPFASSTFDGVLMTFVLELFDTPEIPRVLSECQRVLGRDGRISVVSLSKAGPHSRMCDLYELGHARFPNVLDCRPIFLRRSLEEAGFDTSHTTSASLWGLPVEAVAAVKPDR